MSYNIKHVPPLDVLIAELATYPAHLEYYLKAEVLIGPPNAVDYIYSLSEEKDDI